MIFKSQIFCLKHLIYIIEYSFFRSRINNLLYYDTMIISFCHVLEIPKLSRIQLRKSSFLKMSSISYSYDGQFLSTFWYCGLMMYGSYAFSST